MIVGKTLGISGDCTDSGTPPPTPAPTWFKKHSAGGCGAGGYALVQTKAECDQAVISVGHSQGATAMSSSSWSGGCFIYNDKGAGTPYWNVGPGGGMDGGVSDRYCAQFYPCICRGVE